MSQPHPSAAAKGIYHRAVDSLNLVRGRTGDENIIQMSGGFRFWEGVAGHRWMVGSVVDYGARPAAHKWPLTH